ncbi:hypothetical protein Anas_09970 [Armadillidium nasatum]|uniref:Uncharacterized protein n=1 Tax=Armadillidium nasatum TaxID=96803 RepID=A0A5N5TES7_9CRUS|nr:hypothetical protein Anas_09970 [Armadillidium nasatum]
MMDIQTEYRLSRKLYLSAKFLQLDLTTCAIAVITYPIAIKADLLKHTNETELFDHDGEDSLGLKVNISRNNSYILNETNEQISLSISENSSNIIDTLNEYKGTIMHTVLHLTSDPMIDVFDNVYENVGLITPAIISLVTQVIVALSLGWLEFVKYRIRTQPSQQSHIEMVEISGEESN